MVNSVWRGIGAKLSTLSATTVLLLAGEDDLLDVISAVVDLAGRWKGLGICLGVRQCDLDTILLANSNSPNDCLREMLALWLKQNYDVRTSFVCILPHHMHQAHYCRYGPLS